MFYDYAITVPAKRTRREPVEQELELTKGVIHRVEVQFPIGCRALVHCVLEHEGHQYLPTNPDGNFASDGYVIPIDEYYELKAAPYKLKAVCWSEADTYTYDVNIRIGILAKEVLTPLAGIGGALKRFLKFVGVGG